MDRADRATAEQVAFAYERIKPSLIQHLVQSGALDCQTAEDIVQEIAVGLLTAAQSSSGRPSQECEELFWAALRKTMHEYQQGEQRRKRYECASAT
jgi:DNA-directed RNA polymerase specialized sigma24 family protein